MSSRPVTSARQRRLAAQLLRSWRVSLPAAEWQAVGVASLRAAAEAQLAFGARRMPRQTLLRVSSPRMQIAAGRSYSVVELITDDMPFLVDTLHLTLNEAGYGVQLISIPSSARCAARTDACCIFASEGATANQSANRGSTCASIEFRELSSARRCGCG